MSDQVSREFAEKAGKMIKESRQFETFANREEAVRAAVEEAIDSINQVIAEYKMYRDYYTVGSKPWKTKNARLTSMEAQIRDFKKLLEDQGEE